MKRSIIPLMLIVWLAAGCSKIGTTGSSNSTSSSTRYKQSVFSSITTVSNVTYGSNTTYSGATASLTMDVYYPSGDTALTRPLLILLPGGGFASSTSKSSLADESVAIAKYGYVVACINYRTFDGSGIITNSILKKLLIQGMQDAKAAIRFFRKDASITNTYKINSNKIFLGGHSAGSMVAAHAVYLDDLLKADTAFQTIITVNGGLEGNSGNAGYSSEVIGNINLAGSLLDKTYITSTSKPMLGMYGTADNIMPYDDGTFSLPNALSSISVSGSNSSYNRAVSVGISNNIIYSISGGDHFAPVQTTCTTCLDTIAGFMYSLL